MKINEDTVVWITGASSGIGEACAIEANKKGATVIISARRQAALEKVKESCADPSKVHVITLDLVKSEEMPAKVAKALTIVDKIDVLINSGGVSQRSLIKDTDFEVYRSMMEINFFGTIALTKALLPHFIKNQSGHVSTITSLMGMFSSPKRSGYCASKHALHGFFDSMRAEHYDDNIEVSLICPGYVTTEISMNALTADGSPQQKMDRTTARGISAEKCAQKIIRAIERKKDEVYIGGKEIGAIYLKRFAPWLLNKIVRKVNTT